MPLDIRSYEDADFDAVERIWREVRWIDDSDEHRTGLRTFLEGGRAEVGLIDGAAECLVHRTGGSITYDDRALPSTAVTAVTTSQIGRKLGFASVMTARALQQGADEGAAVAALGMFEQGFYDRLGFATGAPSHRVTFDPRALRVGHVPYRRPLRLTADDAHDMQAAVTGRLRHHGSITLDAPRQLAAEFSWLDHAFALGYRDDAGVLTHFVLGSLKGENGPFQIHVLAYRDTDQLLELLRLLHELSDQFHAVRMEEPAHVQLQLLVDSPIRQRSRTRRTESENGTETIAWWQLRVLDLEACVGARRWPGDPVRFNLALTDPVGEFLADETGTWRGIGGISTITVADASTVEPGHADGLPLVECDVAAFSRLWFGIGPASSLGLTNRFVAPPELCAALDRALLLPRCEPGIYF